MSMNASDLPFDQIGPSQETVDQIAYQDFTSSGESAPSTSMNASDFALDQIGPSAETIQAAINAGFIGSEFTPTPPGGGDGGGASGSAMSGGSGIVIIRYKA